MARVSISVPDDMKLRMDELDGVNWSALAQRAFRETILRKCMRKSKEDDMSDVIERLKLSKKRTMEDLIERGHDAGYDWAKQSADYNELLAISRTSKGGEVHRLLGEHHDMRDNAFWYGDEHEPDDLDAWWDGFREGAIGLFKEVRDRL